jgi:hypothetical protein
MKPRLLRPLPSGSHLLAAWLVSLGPIACGSVSPAPTASDGGAKDSGTLGAFETGANDTGPPAADTGTTKDSGTTPGCPATTVVTGTIVGQPLSPAYAIALKGVADPSYPNQIVVFLSTRSDVCSTLQTKGPGNIANLRDMSFVLGATDPAAGPVTPGTYTPMNTVDEMTAQYDSYDATCNDTSPAWNGGSVVVCGVGASFTGSFDQTFGTDHVTGTFDAPLCDLNLAADASASTCIP